MELLFELRCEELPPKDLAGVVAALEAALARDLGAAGLPCDSTSSLYTPRRITLCAHGLAERSPDTDEVVQGPPSKIAFDAEGKPTRAAEGFARKSGVAVDELQQIDGRLVATIHTPGRPAAEVVAQVLPGLPAQAPWRKSMRWGAPATFARPVRGIVALLGNEVVDCEVIGLRSGRVTRGHPFLHAGDVEIASADRAAYVETLRAAHVLADPAERRARVQELVLAAAPGAQLHEALLDENTNLVEWPSVLVGTFSPDYLTLPERVPVTVMEHHQRFFSVREAGALAPRFVAVLDRAASSADICRPGFERVLVPRLHDASFFMREDRKRRLDAYLPALENVVYHRKLGTLLDKATRLQELAGTLATELGLTAAEVAASRRAGLLAKCDLVTLMVGEFPELQGYVGSVYALQDDEPAGVAAALDVQYRHRFEDGEVVAGAALALLLAETLDIVAQFGARVKLPTGRVDPFGVRRAALTFLDAAERWAPDLDIARVLELAGGNEAVATYVDTRLRQRHRDAGVRPDHLDAVPTYRTVGELRGRIADLVALEQHGSYARLLEVAERCRNITKKASGGIERSGGVGAVDPGLLQEPAEQALFEVWSGVRDTLPAAPARLSRGDVARIADAVAAPLHTFFEQVFVNADDEAVRANRYALLLEIDAALLRFADLCRVVAPKPDASAASGASPESGA